MPPNVIWREALQNLVVAGVLRTLCEKLLSASGLQNNLFQSAIREVIDAESTCTKQIFLNNVLMLDRTGLRSQLNKFELDGELLRVILVRGGPSSGKSHGHFLFESVARDWGALVVYLRESWLSPSMM